MVKRISTVILALSMVFSMGNAVYASEKLTFVRRRICRAGNSCISRSAAMAAALTAISTAFSGPVGTIISGILAVAAAPSLTELCGRVIYAIATKQGIYIKPVLAYPPLKMGYF